MTPIQENTMKEIDEVVAKLRELPIDKRSAVIKELTQLIVGMNADVQKMTSILQNK